MTSIDKPLAFDILNFLINSPLGIFPKSDIDNLLTELLFVHEIKNNNVKNTFNDVLNIIIILCSKFMTIKRIIDEKIFYLSICTIVKRYS